jgi:hypothetical protein
MLRQLGVSLALLLGGAGLAAQPRDLCAQASLSCGKSETGDRQYVCSALAQMPRADDEPQYEWKISGGKIVEGDGSPTLIIDARDVKADALTVKLWVTWRKAPRACRTAVMESKIELH